MKIDFVITWVDGSDLKWRRQKESYMPDHAPDAGENRYRDMGLLPYWFRAVEKYAPWMNKVHFITCGHLPEWLNEKCEKLNIVKHSDYMAEEYLPTFSSRPIELNMCKIEDISEHFVYFNDDMILNAAVEPDFFFKNGLPCDFAYSDNIYYAEKDDMYALTQTNEAKEAARHFSYRKTFFKHPFKYVNYKYPVKSVVKNVLKLGGMYGGFFDLHLACPYLKSDMEKAWELYYEIFDKTSRNKFRAYTDVSQRIFRYMRLNAGKFYPVSKNSRGKVFSICNDNSELIGAMGDENIKMLCINDTPHDVDFEKAKAEITKAYEEKLPEKSQFEK